MAIVFTVLFCGLSFQVSFAQNVGISSTSSFTPDASAGLDISYTNKGLLVPRVALTAINGAGPIVSPAISLLIYNTATAGTAPNNVTPGYYYWSGSTWTSVNTSANGWAYTGNTGTNAGPHFIGTTDAMDFVVKTNSIERARFTSEGNVGIGSAVFSTTNPEKLLVNAGSSSYNVISGKGNLNNYLQFNIQNSNTGDKASSDIVATADDGNETINYVDLGINGSGNTQNMFGGPHDAYLYNTGGSIVGGDFFIGTSTAGKSLAFLTGGTAAANERMRIDGTGKVGIGTNAPGSDFTVYQNANTVGTRGIRLTGNSISGGNTGTGMALTLGYNFVNNKQMWLGDPDYLGVSTGTFVRYSSTFGYTVLDGISGDGLIRKPISLGVAGDANSTVILGNDGSATPSGSYVWANGNMAVGNGYRSYASPANGLLIQGNVGIGTGAAAVPQKLTVAGVVAPSADNMYSLGTSSVRWTTLYANNVVQISDRRFKTNIKALKYGLKEVLDLKPVSYNMKDKPTSDPKLGLIAQDVKKIIPEIVTGDEVKGRLGMNYIELIPVLINAIKEQEKTIEQQQKDIYDLKKKIQQKLEK